jgi:hypothetical protein
VRQQLTGTPVEILTWREAMPTLAQLVSLDEAFNYVMNGVVLAMVGLAIFNTILMRVLERRYEFGLCSALGLRPGQLAVMVIGESLALTTISLGLGLVLGSALVLQEQPAHRSRFRSDHLRAPERNANRVVRRHSISDGDHHLVLSGAQGRANQTARCIEGILA